MKEKRKTKTMDCPECKTVVPAGARFCPGCAADAGFPNVRLANSLQEQEALAKRVADAEVSTQARGCRDALHSFAAAINGSQVVIARNIQRIHDLVSSENTLYVSYYKEIQAGSRIPEDNPWDRGRTAADSTISPYYYDELIYGALSLDGKGVAAFGPYSMVIRDPMIERRATVFEENPFIFCKRHRVTAGQHAPAGFRAAWASRHMLAQAKLHSRLGPDSTQSDYAGILVDSSGVSDTDFIEVHIYGPIYRTAIERVIGPRPAGGAALVIWKSTKNKLDNMGARMEIG